MVQRTLRAVCAATALWALVPGALRAAPTAADLRRVLAIAAERQIGVTTSYDPRYLDIPYPGGDVAAVTGVCADVVVRAFRDIGVDLQVELHEDMKRNFGAYPRLWGLRAPDPNIDHRRVANLMVYFRRRGKVLPPGTKYEPGDIVAWKLRNGLHHIGIVSTWRTTEGRPMMVHNIGRGARLDDILDRYRKIGHYRW